MIIETVVVGPLQSNCYVIAAASGSPAVIIDPGDDEKKIRQALLKHQLVPEFIVNTHGHIDHIGCDDKFGVPVYIHRADAAALEDPVVNMSDFLGLGRSVRVQSRLLQDGEELVSGELVLQVIHTPGHTPGGICLLLRKPVDNLLFTGDTLFYHSVGRTDFPGADGEQIVESIKQKLFCLPDNIVVYPGHGRPSSIGEERAVNPFLH